MNGELLPGLCALAPAQHLALLGALAVILLAMFWWVAIEVTKALWQSEISMERKAGSSMDSKTFVIGEESFTHAQENLGRALALLDQVKGCTPPYFIQRFQACVTAAMSDLGMKHS